MLSWLGLCSRNLGSRCSFGGSRLMSGGGGGNFAPRIRNRNPLNLEKMLIAPKPRGFQLDKFCPTYWNKLSISTKSSKETRAIVRHWTGRLVCSASTSEYAISKHLYNLSDETALKLIGQIIAQRALQTGVSEVFMQIKQEDLAKDRIKTFIETIKDSGLILKEPREYVQFNPHRQLLYATTKPRSTFKPWEVTVD